MSEARSEPSDAQALSRQTGLEAWAEAKETGAEDERTSAPLLVQFAGIPLSGKSTVARAFVKDVDAPVVHTENDALRARIADHLGRPPQQDPEEHKLTYDAAWTLCALALQAGVHAVHDATNLDEDGRRGGYETADRCGAKVFVVFVVTDRAVLDERAAQLSEDRQEAHRKYRDRSVDPEACSRPHVVLDGALDVEANLKRLRERPELRSLYDQ